MIRTHEEIVFRIETESEDFFGTIRGNLLEFLPYELAKPWLPAEATAATWKSRGFPLACTRKVIRGEMASYIGFAWGKANDERGLSASRSINHFQAWLWLIGDEETLAFAEDGDNYSQYGRPILRRICEVYGFDIDDNPRGNF